MESSKLFYFNIDPAYMNSFIQVMIQFAELSLVKLEDISDIVNHGLKTSTQYLILDGNTPARLLKEQLMHLNGATKNIKLLWISNEIFPKDHFNIEIVKEYFKKIEVLQIDQLLLKKMTVLYDFIDDPNINKSSKEETFVPLSTFYLHTLKKAPCDIFLKLGDKKHVKIIAKDDDFKTGEVVQKYSNKNINVFYVTFSSLIKFRDGLLKDLFKIDTKNENKIIYQFEVTESAINIAKDFGVTDILIESVCNNFNEMYKDFNVNKQFKNLLNDLSKINGTEIGKHSYLVSLFATIIGNNLPWFTKEIKKNIYTSALLHDLEFLDSGLDEFEFKSIHEIENVSKFNKDFIINHPSIIAKKLTKIDVIPTDVINIILKHHEGAGDNSYPNKLNGAQLSPSICLFVVAHEFSIQLKKFNYKPESFNNILGNTRQLLSGSSFKNYIDILEIELNKI